MPWRKVPLGRRRWRRRCQSDCGPEHEASAQGGSAGLSVWRLIQAVDQVNGLRKSFIGQSFLVQITGASPKLLPPPHERNQAGDPKAGAVSTTAVMRNPYLPST